MKRTMQRLAGFAAALLFVHGATTFAAFVASRSGAASTHVPAVVAQYSAASSGAGLAHESIAAGEDTVTYCAFDDLDGTTSTPECGRNAVRHKGIGPFTDTSYFTNAAALDVSDVYACAILRPTDLSNAPVVLTTGTVSVDGIELSITAAGAACITTNRVGESASSCSPNGQVLVNKTNLICWGLWTGGSTLGLVKVNSNVVASAEVPVPVVPVSTTALLGRGRTAGHELRGTLTEFAAREGYATTPSFDNIWMFVNMCLTPGACLINHLQSMDPESPWLAALDGETYVIGGNWCGDTDCTVAARWDLTGSTLVTRDRRHSWPAISPTQTGTVPRVAISGIHQRGFGGRHAGLTGWGAGNYLSLGAGLTADVLDFAGDFSLCVAFQTMDLATAPGLFVNSSDSGVTNGYVAWTDTAGNLTVRIGNKAIVPGVVRVGDKNDLCLGRVGTTIYGTLNGAAAVTATGAGTTAATASPARLGRDGSPTPFVGNVYELFATTTPGTAAYLVYLADAARRCTTVGNCYPRDANTVMACTGDDFTGNVLRCGTNTGADAWTTTGTVTTEAVFYQNTDAQRISAAGAGPYSSSNYFQFGTGTTDVFDFSGSWLVCAAFDGLDVDADVVLDGGWVANVGGWQMKRTATGALACTVDSSTAGTGTATTADAYAAGSLNLGCCGWDQSTDTVYARLNGSAIATTSRKFVANAGAASYVGRQVAAGAEHNGRVYEVLALNKAPTMLLLDGIHRRWLGQQSLTGHPLTNTHTSDACRYQSAGNVIGRGANTQRARGATRYSTLYSGTVSTVATSYVVPPGFVTMGAPPNNNRWVLTSNLANIVNPYGAKWNATLTDNAALAPDGTMTATTVREVAGQVTTEVYFDAGISASGYNATPMASVYFRPVGPRNCAQFIFGTWQWGVGWARYAVGSLDIAANKLTLTNLLADIKKVVMGHEFLKDGWIHLWVSTDTFNVAGAHYTFALRIQPGTVCNYTAYTTNASYGFDIWKPTLFEDRNSNLGNDEPFVVPQPAATAGLAACGGETITLPNPLRPSGTDWTNTMMYSESLNGYTLVSDTGCTNCREAWYKSNVTVAGNTRLSPEGSFTADTVTVSGATPGYVGSLIQNAGMFGDGGLLYWPGYFWIKSNGSSRAAFAWYNAAGNVCANTVATILSGPGTVTQPSAPTTPHVISGLSTTAWTHVYVDQTAACASGVALDWNRWAWWPGATDMAGTGQSIGDSIALWGVDFTHSLSVNAKPARSSLYCPTHSTAQQTCGPGAAIAARVTNVYPNSENVAAWTTLTNLTPSLVPVVGPNGSTVRANRLTETGANGTHSADTTFSDDAARTNAFSFIAKTDTRTWARAYLLDSFTPGYCYFDLTTAAVGSCSGATGAIESIGNGWVRGQIIVTSNNGAGLRYGLALAPGNNISSYQGDGTSGIWLLNAQLEKDRGGAGVYCGPTNATAKTCGGAQRWCVRARDATPGYGLPWTRAITPATLAAGGADGAANSWSLKITNAAKVYLDSRDAYGTAYSMNADHAFAAGSTHTIVACVNDGIGAIYYDGSFTPAGTGTVASFTNWSTELTMGSAATGVYSWNGTIGSLDFNTTGDSRDFAWDRRTP